MAVGKHVIAQQALTGGGESVGIDESTDFRIVITGLEIVEPGLDILKLALTPKIGQFGTHFRLSKPRNILDIIIRYRTQFRNY